MHLLSLWVLNICIVLVELKIELTCAGFHYLANLDNWENQARFSKTELMPIMNILLGFSFTMNCLIHYHHLPSFLGTETLSSFVTSLTELWWCRLHLTLIITATVCCWMMWVSLSITHTRTYTPTIKKEKKEKRNRITYFWHAQGQ